MLTFGSQSLWENTILTGLNHDFKKINQRDAGPNNNVRWVFEKPWFPLNPETPGKPEILSGSTAKS